MEDSATWRSSAHERVLINSRLPCPPAVAARLDQLSAETRNRSADFQVCFKPSELGSIAGSVVGGPVPVPIPQSASRKPRSENVVRLGDLLILVPNPSADLRPAIEGHLRTLAAKELTVRTLEFAALHQLSIHRVTIRAQGSRWGSCSFSGVISLNWRLIQTPPFVRDYIILHELMHLRQMNHSARFWKEVERVCPDYRSAKLWLKENPGLLDRE